jgi:Mg/Co/Ni transporter MgtE
MKRNPSDVDSSFPSDSLEDNNYDDDDENNDEEEGLLITNTTNTNNNNTGEEDFAKNVWDRAGWLVGLLVLQSMSSFILARNEVLLQEHTIIIRFLTMLVGAGGNAGNQASVRGTL